MATRSAADIIAQTARDCYKKTQGGDCPPELIPREEELLDFAAARVPPGVPLIFLAGAVCPKDALEEAAQRLCTLYGTQDGAWNWFAYLEPPEDWDVEGPVYFGPPGVEDPPQPGQLAALWSDGLNYGIKTLPELTEDFDNLPEAKRGKFPLTPIVRSWQQKPQIAQAESRRDPIFPAPAIMVKREDARARLFSPSAHLRPTRGGGMQYLPGFAPGEEHGGPVTPVLPLHLYDLGAGANDRPQRTAPLALRIFVESCLSVPLTKRDGQRPVLLPPERLGEYLNRLYPGGPEDWRPSRHLPRLMAAFEALLSPQARIPWQDLETGEGAARLVVVPVDIPREGRLDDWVRFQVFLPPGSERGPLIDRPVLIRAGAESAVKYRLALSLSFWWHNPGRLQFPVGRGGPWRLPRDGSRYPEVTDVELVSMAFPIGGRTQFRRQLYNATQALKELVAEGFAAVAPTRRIYPGKHWVGWGD